MKNGLHPENVDLIAVSALRPYPGNARTHSKKQIRQIADSIERFGFNNPILAGDDGQIIAGHGRLEAAKLLGWDKVPVVRLSHLSDAERRAYILADNKLALNAGWDQETLAIELQCLIDLNFDVGLTGFSISEIDMTLDGARNASPDSSTGPEDEIPLKATKPVTRSGDLWLLGRHRLLCGDALNAGDYARLLDGDVVDLIFTDPPFNVPIDGNVTGLGRIRHREFAMGAGEMSADAFEAFLATSLSAMSGVCRDGAIAYVCMDWRHVGELTAAGRAAFTELKNICVWNKTNGGMGTFYRSKHELVFVFKVGSAAHVNSFGLGAGGRYRTNVWDYPGVSSAGSDRAEALEMHPTVKPTALVVDALKDCSKRGDVILDGFAGSGTTLIAAEVCGRRARLLELDPLYCDVIVRRYQRLTGKQAVLAGSNTPFDDLSEVCGDKENG